MVAAERLDFQAHAEDSCGLINGGPEGRGFFLCLIWHFYYAVKHHMHGIWIFISLLWRLLRLQMHTVKGNLLKY